MTTSEPDSAETSTRDGEILADLFDAMLQEILEGRNPDLATFHPDRPDLRDRIAKTWALACSVAGRREPSRPVMGGYEILRELGHGGMGTVYLARHQALQREVAIKVLPQSLAMSPRAKQRFLEEARALARLQHDSIVHIHRIIDHAEMLAFEMEYIDGPSLQKLILELRQKDKPHSVASLALVLGVPVETIGTRNGAEWFVRVGITMARALAAVHRHGLVHRDVKPSNILLRADGRPVLADFGLALDGEPDATRSGAFAGTPVYAAPERLRGGDVAADARSDVYSLAITLYEALSLVPPFAGTTTHEVLRLIEAGDLTKLRQHAPHVSHDLEIVLGKAMERDPRHRYANADEFADDLERLLNLQPIHAQPAGPLRRAVKFVRRNHRLVTAAAAGAVLVALVAWPIAAHARATNSARERAAGAWHEARTLLLSPESLQSSWAAWHAEGQTLRSAVADRAMTAAFAASLAAYDRASAATPDDADLQRERRVVAAVAALRREMASPSANPTVPDDLPPLAHGMLRRATEHRRLGDDLASLLPAASTGDRFAAGLAAFLWGDYAANRACWHDLPTSPRDEPLVDACTALRLAGEGERERAYPRLFHAARAFPRSSALAIAMADTSLAVGDLAQARRWLQAVSENDEEIAASRRGLLVADLLAAEGKLAEARRDYRELARQDVGDPRPPLRLASLALLENDRPTARRLLEYVLRRWPDLLPARLGLARMALQQRDTPSYLGHARFVLAETLAQPSTAAGQFTAILRLGGLQDALPERAADGAPLPIEADRDAALPLSIWLPPTQVAGIQQALRLVATFDVAVTKAARVDARPLGATLRGAWLTLLQLPRLTTALPWPCQVLGIAGIPALLGKPTNLAAELLLPYQNSLGDRLRRIPMRQLFSERLEADSVAYASQVLRVGDLDGDTLEELCVCAPPAGRNSGNGFVELRAFDDGRLLRTWTDDGEDGAFARALAVLGDIDGDLCNDLLIGVPLARFGSSAAAKVELRSGRTGACIWTIDHDTMSFGVSLAAIGDVDGDGAPDFAVGMSPMSITQDERGRALLCSGGTGAVLHELVAERSGVWFGGSTANAGDVTGDGVDDVVVGGNYGGAPGLVAIFDGKSGAQVVSIGDDSVDTDFGRSVLGVGDVDGDGRADIAVSAPAPHQAGIETGKVHVFSGRTGKVLYELRGERAHEGFGTTMCRLPDWRGDGRAAIAIGSRGGGPIGNGYVRVFDLQRGSPLQTVAGNAGLRAFGYSLVDLGDRDRDGLRDLGVVSLGFDEIVRLTVVTFSDTFAK